MRRLVVLRPEPGATATCNAARALGLDPVSLPLFRIAPVAWDAPDPAEFDGLLLTSANAVLHAGAELQRVRGLPAFTVGQATAAAARDAGLSVSFIGAEGVDDLLARLDPELRLLHLCSEQYRAPSAAGQPITHVPVYRPVEVDRPDLAPAAGAVVAVYSAQSAARFAALVAAQGVDAGSVAIAAISSDAARAAGSRWETVEVADAPDDAALLALASRLCNNPAG